MRRRNPYREELRRILRDEQQARPGCALLSTLGVDEDGRAFIHFSCLSHEATWRYYIHVNVDTELATSSYSGSELSSRCPSSRQAGLPYRPEIPEEDSQAEASLDEPTFSCEELHGGSDEVS